jgi:hypothetical protein
MGGEKAQNIKIVLEWQASCHSHMTPLKEAVLWGTVSGLNGSAFSLPPRAVSGFKIAILFYKIYRILLLFFPKVKDNRFIMSYWCEKVNFLKNERYLCRSTAFRVVGFVLVFFIDFCLFRIRETRTVSERLSSSVRSSVTSMLPSMTSGM